MKAIAYQEFGTSDVIQVMELARPVPSAKQVLIKVKAVSINPMDWKIRKGEMKLMSGSHFPRIIGAEFAGTIEALGDNARKYAVGDEVFGAVNAMKEGALAEYIALDEDKIWPKPQSLSYGQAATIPIAGGAAATVLEKMDGTAAGMEVLVNGASGGFGMYLVQLLKQQGAVVTAVSGSEGIEFAKQWGATNTIDYTQQNVLDSPQHYDVVIDLSGKMKYEDAKKVMKEHSVYINSTPKPAEIITSPILDIFTSKKHIALLSDPSDKNIRRMLEAIGQGLRIEINKTFAFDQAKQAYEYAERGGYVGKVVVELP